MTKIFTKVQTYNMLQHLKTKSITSKAGMGMGVHGFPPDCNLKLDPLPQRKVQKYHLCTPSLLEIRGQEYRKLR